MVSQADFDAFTDNISNRMALLERLLGAHTNSKSPHPGMLFPGPAIHGPTRSSVDGTHSMTFIVDFDTTIAILHQSMLTFRLAAVRSNVSAASSASGGSTTSSAGSSHTHVITPSLTGDSGGSSTPTSAAGSSHTHTVTGGTAAADITNFENINHYNSATGNPSSASTDVQSVSHTHLENGTGNQTGLDSVNHSHSMMSHNHTIGDGTSINVSLQAHTHSLSGITNAAEATHTHSVTIAAHSHTVSGSVTAASESAHTHTIGNHTHTITMTYGIYEGAAPSTPGITITINGTSRTTALGGPWNTGQTLDITTYLKDGASGAPLRQANSIVLTSTELLDLEVVCKSFVSMVPPFLAGVAAP